MSKDFKRQETHKRDRVKSSWRKPIGHHSNARLKKKSAQKMPKAGFRTPKEDRGKHPSGYEEVMVHNTDDLEEVDPEVEAARIGSTVGGRKREQIIEKADDLEVKVLNRGEE